MQPVKTLATALALSSALTCSALAATKVGVIGAANPQVFATSESGSERALKVGDDVFLNDALRTDGKGSAQLMFLDRSALTISPGSTVVIDKFVYDPAAKDGSMTLNSAKGAFRFIGGALTKKKAVNIKTPVSTIGIRGGIVDTHVEAGGQTDAVFLFGKEMTMTNAQGQTSSTTQFGTGLGLVNPNAAPVSLPQSVVATRIGNSPTAAAVRSAPPASDTQLQRIEQKVNIKSGQPPAGGGGSNDGTPSGGGNSSGNSSSGNGGNSSNNSGGATSNNNTATGAGTTGNDATDNATNNGADNATNSGADADNDNALLAAAGFESTGFEEGSEDLAFDGGAPGLEGGDTNTAQEELRNDVETFVESGGDGDGDGQRDFDLASETGDDGDSLFDLLFGDDTTSDDGGINPNDTTATTDTTGNDDDGSTDTTDTAGDDTTDLTDATDGTDDGTNDNTNDGTDTTDTAGDTTNTTTGGGGGGVANDPPFASHGVLLSGDEHTLFTNNSRVISVSDLLSNVTDPEGDALSIVPGSATVSSGNGQIVYDFSVCGGYCLNTDDIAPGQNEIVTISYQVTDGQSTVSASQDIDITGQDFFGGTDPWSTTLPALPGTIGTAGTPVGDAQKNMRGKLFYRNDGGSSATGDDEIEIGYIQAFTGTDDTMADGYKSRFDSENVFHSNIEWKSTDGTYSGLAAPAGPAHENVIIGRMSDLPAGYWDLYYLDARIEDQNGKTDISDTFEGFTYRTSPDGGTTDGNFIYYQMDWFKEGTSQTNIEYVRTFLVDSPIYADTVIGDAQTTFDTMMTESVGWAHANSTTNIIEYDFLPNMAVDLDGSGNEYFGEIDYNVQPDLVTNNWYTAPLNDNGLFVDWQNKKFLGGYVDFDGLGSGSPGVRALFGKVNDGANAITNFDTLTGALDGNALDGSYYALDQDVDFASSHRDHTKVKANPAYFGSSGGVDQPIEGFVVETELPGGPTVGEQAVVIGDGANATLLNTPATSGPILEGFSAGLITDSANEVSRIKTAAPNEVRVHINGAADVGATITYHEVDTIGRFDDAAGTQTVKFGVDNTAAAASAAIQMDAYAAEATGPDLHTDGDVVETKGVMVSMHETVAPGQHNLVCDTCEFAHWGVWQADHIDGTGAVEKSLLVPYVAGEVTTDITGPVGPGGTHTYSGEALANVAVTPDGGPTQIHNATGIMEADIDLTNRKILASGLNIDFTNVGGDASRAIHIHNDAVMNFDAGKNTFTGQINRTITAADGSTTGSGLEGQLNGALFGPNAEEVGGNFYTQGDTNPSAGGEVISTGGVFLGKR